MTPETQPSRNWFSGGGEAYARYRPAYPAALAAYLAGVAPDRRLAVDAGCGNGQLTRLLAAEFDAVVGVDPSGSQLANAAPDARIRYECAPAERLPLPDACASLVTAAQAAHWFDLPAFYAEVRRIGVPGAVVALVSYGVLSLDEAPGSPLSSPFSSPLDARFQAFYAGEIGPYWPPERRLVDTGYATIDFPFAPLAAPHLAIRLDWTLDEFLGYVGTWSAVRAAREDGREALLEGFAQDLREAWGDPQAKRPVRWPVSMRIGRV